MGVKFVDGANAPVDPPVAVIYGPPGVGKTSLALTVRKPALLDFDRGAHRSANKAGKAVLPINTWKDVVGMEAADVEPYSDIIVDTVGECLESLARDIVARDPAYGTNDALNLRGYGVLKTRFSKWLAFVRGCGKRVILIAHMNEEQKGDRTMERIIAQGASRNLIYQKADLMGRLLADAQGRYLTFNPSLAAYGKNPGLPDTRVPPPEKEPDLMERIMCAAYQKMCENAGQGGGEKPKAEQQQAQAQPAKPAKPEPFPDDVEGLNERVAKMVEEGAPVADKKAIVEHGEKLGLTFDGDAKKFTKGAPF